MLGIVPTVDWVLLGSGKSKKGYNLAASTWSLSADAPCLLAGKARNNNSKKKII